MHDPHDTIVAVATPAGRGGLGCVRLSGPQALAIGGALHRPREAGAECTPGGSPLFGTFCDRESRELDHGYLVQFAEGRSFTGEATAELWCHGSPAVLAELLAAALAAGARAATPGEFTYRAMHNGRIDLARAEAVRDLIDARTAFQARVAFAQADGALSRHLSPLRERLEEWIARTEAAVEFSDESDTHMTRERLAEAIEETRVVAGRLLDGFEGGRVVRDGAALALVGRPNVGKSSLFNALVARERAIVTEVAGTTRDTLEEQIDLEGVPLRVIDTAGLREVDDAVEAEGVRRAEHARAEADLVLLVLDGSRPPELDERDALAAAADDERGTVVLANKSDLSAGGAAEGVPTSALRVSAKTGAGLDTLRSTIRERLLGRELPEDPLLTNARHADALRAADAALGRAAAATESGLSEELVLEDLREAMKRLGEITGELTSEALYDRIFSTFCIGK